MSQNEKYLGIDIDGTLTDFNGYVLRNSISYMKNKYGCEIVNADGYDLDDIYDLKRTFIAQGHSSEDAVIAAKDVTEKFWNRFYLQYCFFTRMRKGARRSIRNLKRLGFKVIIISSRNKTCDKSLLGKFVRMSAKFQLAVNGIFPHKTVFMPDDSAKLNFIYKLAPAAMVEDKPEIAQLLSGRGVRVVLIDTPYNKTLNSSDVLRVKTWDDVTQIMCNLL